MYPNTHTTNNKFDDSFLLLDEEFDLERARSDVVLPQAEVASIRALAAVAANSFCVKCVM